jgi:peptidoglycan/xylan/chitin deacetylase (PgdA/CDA1 family)
LTLLPFLIRELAQRRRVTIVTYHDPTPQVFDTHVTVLRRVYNIVSLTTYADAMRNGVVSKLPPKALIITLDDGHRGNYALKSVLDKHRVPITIFLCSGLVNTRRQFWFRHEAVQPIVQQLKAVPDEQRLAILRGAGFAEEREFAERQALSDAEVEELQARSVDFQSHSVFHPILPRCVSARAEAEITYSKSDLETKLSTEIYAFAYPNGSYGARELEFVKTAGYRCALTLDPGSNSATSPPFRLRRICLSDSADRNELLVKASGLWGGILAVLGRVGQLRDSRSRIRRRDAVTSIAPLMPSTPIRLSHSSDDHLR